MLLQISIHLSNKDTHFSHELLFQVIRPNYKLIPNVLAIMGSFFVVAESF